MPTVAVDLLGTDKGPKEVVEGIKIAIERMRKDNPYRVAVVGPSVWISPLVDEFGLAAIDPRFPCDKVLWANDSLRVVFQAGDSSVAQSIRLVTQGSANGALLCGDTRSAAFWASLPPDKEGPMGLMPGILHPPLALTMPKYGSQRGILLDGGTSADCSPDMLVQFAYLGRIFGQLALGIKDPLVGLHSNGEEDGKGNKASKEAFRLLKNAGFPNFVGNVQPSDLVAAEVDNELFRNLFGNPSFKQVDVDASDGFVGNALFKGLEGGVKLTLESLLRNAMASWRTKIGLWMLKPALLAVKAELDPRQFGAMPLLGTNGLIMIGHGSSDRYAIANGIEATLRYIELDLVGKIRAEVQRLGWTS